ncbi:MAG: ABC transporter substrate-binding protein [Kutzneria sp.]|nr:ABC transporter substrate-binding protein [Kutzneria sp.]
MAALAAATAFASGCGLLNGPGGQQDSGSTGRTTVKVGIVPVIDAAPAKLAQERGYFAEEGIDVQVRTYASGAQALPALNSGEIDVTTINYVSFIQAVVNKAVSAKVIADSYQATPDSLVLLAKPETGIREPRDLMHKRVSIHHSGNIAELLVRAVMQDNGLDPNSVTYLPIPYADIPAALGNNLIEAGVDQEPYITQAEEQVGAVPTFKIVTGATADIPISGYIASDKFIQTHSAAVAAFQRAMSKGQKAATDITALASVLPALGVADSQKASLFKLGTFPTSVDATRLQRVATLMQAYHFIPQQVDVRAMILPGPSGS